MFTSKEKKINNRNYAIESKIRKEINTKTKHKLKIYYIIIESTTSKVYKNIFLKQNTTTNEQKNNENEQNNKEEKNQWDDLTLWYGISDVSKRTRTIHNTHTHIAI